MGIGVWSLIVYLASIIIWNMVVKRNICEAMGVGVVVASLFTGKNALSMIVQGFVYASTQEVTFAAMSFVFMATIMQKTGTINRLVEILNSVLGRLTGGAAYVSTIASGLFGMVSGSGTGNAATVGSITVPWMMKTNWSPVQAAVINSGNAGLGIAIPPSSSMFLLLGLAGVAGKVDPGALYIALFCGGMWVLAYRLLLVRYFVYKYQIKAIASDTIKPFRESIREGWTSFLIFLGIILPLVITVGPLSVYLGSLKSFGTKAVSAVSIITWVPMLITLIALLVGRKYLPKKVSEWNELIKNTGKIMALTGATSVFAFAGNYIFEKIGLAADMSALLTGLNMPAILMIVVVGILIVVAAGPLSATATTVALGGSSFLALLSVGINPTVAAVAFLLFVSLEGATPPSAAPIWISCGIAEVPIEKTFKPLLIYYVIPCTILAVLVALGILPLYLI